MYLTDLSFVVQTGTSITEKREGIAS